MQGFIDLQRVPPNKKIAVERIKNFEEIEEVFSSNEASGQSDRCIQCGIPYCSYGCPLHNYIPNWLKSMAEKNLELAFKLSNETSPFPEVMGRICPHDKLCEGACTLNDKHGAVTIGAVETHITEEGFKKGLKLKSAKYKIGKKVSVIGSGPAGLSLATYLLRDGIDVDMYEKDDIAGGLLVYGIPNFKMDKKIVHRRVAMLKEMGLNLILNTEVGKDISFEDIMKNSDAVFIGIGAQKPRKASIEGEDSTLKAIDFLRAVQKRENGNKLDSKYNVKGLNVVVIGGGDTSMDCIRTSIREGASRVTCIYRRDAKAMPGSKKEYENSLEEGAEFIFNASPKQIIADKKNKVCAIEVVRTQANSGDKGILEVNGSEFRVDADVVIMSLGFTPAIPTFLKENGIKTDGSGKIIIDKNYQSSTAGVFAGGDCFRGANLVVNAAYDGREASKSIIKDFTGGY